MEITSMNEFDVIALTVAVGTLLLAAACAGCGMLWQRQKLLREVLQTAWNGTGSQLHAASLPEADADAVVSPSVLAAQAAPAAAPAATPAPDSNQAVDRWASASDAGYRDTVSALIRQVPDGVHTVHVGIPLGSVSNSMPERRVLSEEDRLKQLLAAARPVSRGAPAPQIRPC